jgi:hypothetical protein
MVQSAKMYTAGAQTIRSNNTDSAQKNLKLGCRMAKNDSAGEQYGPKKTKISGYTE